MTNCMFGPTDVIKFLGGTLDVEKLLFIGCMYISLSIYKVYPCPFIWFLLEGFAIFQDALQGFFKSEI